MNSNMKELEELKIALEEANKEMKDKNEKLQKKLLEEKDVKFVYKNNKNSIGINADLVLKYPGSYLYKEFMSNRRTADGNVFIDCDNENDELMIKYMKNDKSLIEDLKSMKMEEKKKLLANLSFFELPVKKNILCKISFESDNEIMEAWRNRIIKINYQYVPSFNEVLRLNQLFDIHFSNQKLQNIHYDKERNVFYVNYDLLFMAIIEDYLKNGKKINNGLVESYRDAGKSTTLISEMNLIGINLNSNEEMIITECFDDRYLRGSVILLDSQYNHYFEKWLGNDKKWKLIYRASKYNYTAKSFHKYCDDKGPTLVLIESSEGWIFGGYTTQSWSGDSICYKIIL